MTDTVGSNFNQQAKSGDDGGGDIFQNQQQAGAGGGGYLYMVAKDPEAAARIKVILNANRPNGNARFVGMNLSKTGLQVSRS